MKYKLMSLTLIFFVNNIVGEQIDHASFGHLASNENVRNASTKMDEFLVGLDQVLYLEQISQENKNSLSQLWPWQEIQECFKLAETQPEILKQLYSAVFKKCLEKIDLVYDMDFLNWFFTNERFTFFSTLEQFGGKNIAEEKSVQDDLELIYRALLSRAKVANYLAGLQLKNWVLPDYLTNRQSLFTRRATNWAYQAIEGLFIDIDSPLSWAQSIFEPGATSFTKLLSEQNYLEYRYLAYQVVLGPIMTLGRPSALLGYYSQLMGAASRLNARIIRNPAVYPYLVNGKTKLYILLNGEIEKLSASQPEVKVQLDGGAVDFKI